MKDDGWRYGCAFIRGSDRRNLLEYGPDMQGFAGQRNDAYASTCMVSEDELQRGRGGLTWKRAHGISGMRTDKITDSHRIQHIKSGGSTLPYPPSVSLVYTRTITHVRLGLPYN